MDTTSTESELLDSSALSSLLDINSLLGALLPMLIVSSIILVVLVGISLSRHHKQRKMIQQAHDDIHAIRELLESRFGNTNTYTSRPAPLNEELESDPQIPARP